MVYQATGQPQRALQLYEQALPLRREVGDRAGEAATLNNMAGVYQATGQPQRALQLYEQALPLRREVGDRAGEATTLNNMAMVYQATGQPQRALQLYEQALPLRREVGDRAGEAATLNGMAYLAMEMQRFPEALTLFEQSIALEQQVGHRAGEIAGLVGAASLLYQHLNRQPDAVALLDQALAIFQQTGLPQDAAGHSPATVQQLRNVMYNGQYSDTIQSNTQTMPPEQIEAIVANTIVVMTRMPQEHAKWHGIIEHALADAQQRGTDWGIEVDFFTAVLATLDNRAPVLVEGHPYAPAIMAIQQGITATTSEPAGPAPVLTVDVELVSGSVAALLGTPQQKLAHAQRLAALAAGSDDTGFQQLTTTIQTALFGAPLAELGGDLAGPYRQAWDAIAHAVLHDGVDPDLFEAIIANTLATLRPVAGQRSEWRSNLVELHDQAAQGGKQHLARLTTAIIALLDANGDPAGLGVGLAGIYAQTWQAILAGLPPAGAHPA
jgi:Tfp pilus assembly protein PilF